MAAVRARGQITIGSGQWVQDENVQVAQFCAQEAEDFGFSARNEAEWLNEHLADIFSKDQVSVTDIFKTPGKLRGKTPRTEKHSALDRTRQPLTDVFSVNARNTPLSSQKSRAAKLHSPVRQATFTVAEDKDVRQTAHQATKNNTDSGYHGTSEDDMDVDVPPIQSPNETYDTLDDFPHSPSRKPLPIDGRYEGSKNAEGSFHSAKENVSKDVTADCSYPVGLSKEDVVDVDQSTNEGRACAISSNKEPTHVADMELNVSHKDLHEDIVVDESRSSSEESSPAHPLVRKSSLTFASLPPREPLTTKKSLGARISRTSHLDGKGAAQQGSVFGRFNGGRSFGGSKHLEIESQEGKDDADLDIDAIQRPDLNTEESDGDMKITRLHNKSSTQLLHDKITLLGKSQPPRLTKSIPAAEHSISSLQRRSVPKSQDPPDQSHAAKATDGEDDDDWIQPPQQPSNASNRPLPLKDTLADGTNISRNKAPTGNQVSAMRQDHTEVRQVALPSQHLKQQGSQSESAGGGLACQSLLLGKDDADERQRTEDNARSAVLVETVDASATPTCSPASKRYVDGPLSASKSRLRSIMKTARGLFSSSAGVSAQAKLETLSFSTDAGEQSQEPLGQGLARDLAMIGEAGTERSAQYQASKDGPVNQAPPKPADTRKTRSSTEKERDAAERQRLSVERQKAQEHELQKPPTLNQAPLMAEQPKSIRSVNQAIRQSPRKAQAQEIFKPEGAIELDTVPPSLNQSESCAQGRPSQVQKPKDPRRPIRPAKEAAPKPKAPPVNIRVGTLSQRIPLNNATLSSSLQDSLPPSQPKQPALAKKASTASIQSSASNTTGKSTAAAVAAKPKALIAAERKKEQDEREAQRKIEQKREIERKRAAQQEEARRHEQVQRLEIEKQRERERLAAAEDPKKIAQKQAIEKRRMELNKKDHRAPQAPGTHQMQSASTSRPELNGARPPSRLHNLVDQNRPANAYVASAPKPPNKRIFDPEADNGSIRPVRPQGGASYQQNDSKRRKTEESDLEEFPIRPTMAPPIRQSGIRKDAPKSSIFNSSYSTAPPPAPHHGPSLLKTTTANQAFQQHTASNQSSRAGYHPDISKYKDGKIPFAEVHNPPSHGQAHKTPLLSRLVPPSAKQSPQYVNGENIHLDDIPTESEDEDSDEEKPKPTNLPEWAQSPQLRQLLMTQDEHMDADAVFGPVASPHMEEMFRERHHRFRSRTSSANWAGQDRLTEEEIRRDVEARARLRREGGWTFGL